MSHSIENQKKLGLRINRIKGQIDALEKSLQNGDACASFLHQVASVRGAIDGLMAEALEGHIREHLDPAHHEDTHTRQQDLNEVINVLKTYLK